MLFLLFHQHYITEIPSLRYHNTYDHFESLIGEQSLVLQY